jgi:hypothetical protein
VLGVPEAQIDAELGPKDEGFQVWPENWPALQAFLAVQTQWAIGMNGPTGLDYTRVRAGLELAGVETTPALFQKLRILESAALAALSKRTKKH